ncbi:MAG: NADH-quinone oxidoreductase subunit C [Candidatus Hadarchaeales archaeon]
MTDLSAGEILESLGGETEAKIVYARERRAIVEIEPRAIRRASELLSKSGRFMMLAAVDEGLNIELLYNFDIGGMVVVLRVVVMKEASEIDSISDLIPAAEWAEREVAELFGVKFKAHPRPAPLLLPEGWSESPPLRAPFEGELPTQICPVAESLISVGATAPLSPHMQRRRSEAGLPASPPASYASEEALRELQELMKRVAFDKKAGYDWERKKLRRG